MDLSLDRLFGCVKQQSHGKFCRSTLENLEKFCDVLLRTFDKYLASR